MKHPLFIWVFHCLISALSILQAQSVEKLPEAKALWRAGVAKIIITPQENMWMAGFAARDKPASGMLHDLWARSLVLEDNDGHRVLLITIDMIGFEKDLSASICSRLEEKYGLRRKNIVLSFSHTHCGPVINRNLSLIYPPFDENQKELIENNRKFVEDQIIKVAGRAINSLEPAHVYSGTGITRFAVNRRENQWNDETAYSPDVKGPSDHVVQVIKVTNLSGRPMVALFGYSCHPTTLMMNKWSGDYPGFAQIELEKTYPGQISMFFNGFGADQDPLPRGKLLQAKQYGKELAIAVESIMEGSMRALSPTIRTIYSEIELALAPPPENAQLEKVIEGGVNWQVRWAEKMKEKLAAGDEFPASYPCYPVQSLQLGEQTLVVLGGEVVVDYAFALRDTLGNDLMIMAYANDVMSYIPSERILKEGRYEGETSMWVYGHHGKWVSGIEEKIINEVVQQVTLNRNGLQ
ncbi:MAG: neutral/alkaline non-lysosomal ceramidase N-terminal domain-containing protein [Bacteroidota bacterium]